MPPLFRALPAPLRVFTAIVQTLLPLAACLALAQGASADEPADGGFGDVVDVELVNVEVWVTDREGEPIRDLTQESFRVFEDGEEVEIQYFDVVRTAPGGFEPRPLEQSTREDGLVTSAPELITSRVDGSAAGPVESSAGWMVLYFDQLHLGKTQQTEIIADLRDLVRSPTVDPERILVVRQSQNLVTETLFGSTEREVHRALDRVEESDTAGNQGAQDKRLALADLQREWDRIRNSNIPTSDPCDLFPPQAIRVVERYTQERLPRMQTSLDNLFVLSSFLAAIPGQKSLLYISDALETEPGADLIRFVEDACPNQRDVTNNFSFRGGLGSQFRRLTDHANANRVTVYAMQAKGLETGFLSGVDQGSLEFRGAGGVERALRSVEREGLATLAGDTGGRTVFNQNDFTDSLIDISKDMGSYYSLAYVPRHGGDELSHRIEVKVEGRGLRVRHRQGYRDKDADTRMTERLQGALHLGWVENEWGVRLAMGTAETARGRTRFPLHVRVPGSGLTFLPGAQGDTARIRVQVLTRPLSGNEPFSHLETFEMKKPGRLDLPVDFRVPVDLASGLHILAVAVRDMASQETAILSTNLDLTRR
ncbi:MAG: VWA domain-containing protein [Acidobacteriota bacterium]